MTKYIVAALLAVACNTAFSSTLALSSSSTNARWFTDSSGLNTIPVGSLVRVGTLTDPANAATFVEFGTSTVGSSTAFATPGGRISGGVSNTVVAPFVGKPIYLWVYSTPTATGNQNALFLAATTPPAGGVSAFPSTWTGAASENASLVLGLTTGEITMTPVTGIANYTGQAGTVTNMANLGLTTQGTTATGVRYTLGGPVIPEPSSLGLIALMGLAALRRKR